MAIRVGINGYGPVHGKFPGEVEVDGGYMVVNDEWGFSNRMIDTTLAWLQAS